jgi:hypothetical protein
LGFAWLADARPVCTTAGTALFAATFPVTGFPLSGQAASSTQLQTILTSRKAIFTISLISLPGKDL